MSKKKNKKLTLDFDFEATVLDNELEQPPFDQQARLSVQPIVQIQTQSEIDAQDEIERRRKIRLRQRQLQEEGQPNNQHGLVAALTSSNTTTFTTTPVVLISSHHTGEPSQSMLDGSNSLQQRPQNNHPDRQRTESRLEASIHFTAPEPSAKMTKTLTIGKFHHGRDNQDEDEDDEDDEDKPFLTFVSSTKRKSIAINTVGALVKSSIETIQDHAHAMNLVSDAQITTSIEEKKANSANVALIDGFPDDTDHLEDLQVDVMMWREREAKRLITEMEVLMRHLDLE